MAEKIRVLVVDDSAFMRRIISDILSEDPDMVVIDTAKNGQEALEKIKLLAPDVVTMDIEMPVMDGISCLKKLRRQKFVPVVVLSSYTREGEKATIEALENGAIDFVAKPVNIFDLTGNAKKQEIIEKIKVASKVKVASRTSRIPSGQKAHQISGTAAKSGAATAGGIQAKASARPEEVKCIIAIGTSTGGPKSLQEVIPLIPGDIPAAVFVTQHMPPGFTRSLAERLNSLSSLTVKEAEDNEIVYAGTVYIAPGDYHMLLENLDGDKLKIKLSKDPPVGGHRPSVDVMMESISRTGIKKVMAIIMTGMGRDGSDGIKMLKTQNNGYIVAQDEKSCVVYGMPRIAVETGVVDAIIPLKGIAKEIIKFVGVYA